MDEKLFDEFVIMYKKNPFTVCENIDDILKFTVIKTYFVDEHIYHEEDKTDFCYFILTGSVEIYKYTDQFNKRTHAVLRKGDSFGFPELFESHYGVNARAIENSKIAALSSEKFFNIISENKSFCLDIMKMMASVINAYQQTIAVTRGDNRFYSYLYHLARSNQSNEEKIVIPNKIKYEDIGNILGITRETVNRLFSSLKKESIIELSKDSITILNLPKLKSLAYSKGFLIGFYDGPLK